jgi:hypothetical protein
MHHLYASSATHICTITELHIILFRILLVVVLHSATTQLYKCNYFLGNSSLLYEVSVVVEQDFIRAADLT